MAPFYRFFRSNPESLKLIPGVVLSGLLFFTSPTASAATRQEDCSDGFATTIESVQVEDQCVVLELLIEATGTSKFALSHFIAEVPCGEISAASNSEGWKMEYPVTDPTSGVTGIKVDDISGFGENGPETFRLTYTVCATDDTCLDMILQQSFEVAYKAGTCISKEVITPVNQPLSANLEATHLTCFGADNGNIVVTVNGGVPPYQFQWSNGDTSQNIENLPKGIYNLTITDAAENSLVLSTQMEEPSPIQASANVTKTECGQAAGAIDLSVNGGTGPYKFLWSEGQTTEDLNQLFAGNYSVTITDSNGCQKEVSYTVKETSSLQIEASQINLQCHETGSGSINIDVSGGTAPYSYLWSTGDTTKNLSNLDEGTYFIWVSDDMGCNQSRQIKVTKEQIQAEITSINAGCLEDNGSATITSLNGSEPYNIEWANGETGLTANNLAPGTHFVEITDSNGCQTTEEVTINRDNGPQIIVSSAWTGCSTEDSIEVSLTASGGQEPYKWLVSEEFSSETFYVTKETELLVTATDQNGCATSEMVTVSPNPAGPQINLNIIDASCTNPTGAASVIVQGEGPFPVFWDGIQGSTYKGGLEPGTHEVKVVDSNGCETIEAFSISEMVVPTVKILTTETEVDCNSPNNLLNATVTNAET
ncbi:SprB repeat-containing protein [Marinilabilia sp.]|uniref:SprB repeat-containing protein n=1 Tax=Marinilabilia sp. TaxID=2021252 RepID=UPI0025C0D425|nr:SprB repeat-containing protein [Marinilabilia sp.]